MNTQASNPIAALAGTSINHTFNFREDKKTGHKREALTVKLPVPTPSEVSAVLSGEQADNPDLANVRDFIMGAIQGLVIGAAKAIVDDNTAFQPEDMSKFHKEVSLDYIANLPRAQRGGITNAALVAFGDFFKQVAVERLELTDKQAENLGNIFSDRKEFAKYLTTDDTRQVLAVRLESLSAAITSEEQDEHNTAITFLATSIDEMNKPKLEVKDL